MQEIHHRLKNNLTMITSLINLRIQESREEGTLKDIQSKIYAVSALYEKLYREGETSKIELGSYLEDIIYSIFATLCDVPFDIQIEVDEIYAPPETAITLALISNEIATNAIKYGFTKDRRNTFFVRMERDESTGGYIYTLGNTGKPFPEDIQMGTTPSLGLQLIKTLVEQLQGKVELTKKPYPEYRIFIPAEKGAAGEGR
ncbi:MAG: sensor histidine kinase [Spirochaetia bacterium]